jgi:hypothetical protein
MKRKILTRSLLAAGIMLGVQAQAADIRINGFASIGAGKTLSQGIDNTNTGSASGKSTFGADLPSQGTYDETFDFKADSVYGLQFSSDLGDGLSVTGQITGAGGEDFEAKVAWAYVSYELSDSWTVQAGRQRIPFFFYSDFLDVGYAYHWMRPPTETNLAVDSFDGIQFRWQGSMGNWDSRAQIYGGTNETLTPQIGAIGLDNIIGGVFYTSNDWLQLRATHLVADFWGANLDKSLVGGLAGLAAFAKNDSFLDNVQNGQGEDAPIDVSFSGLAAHATFGNAFVVAEYTVYEFDEALLGEGWKTVEGSYISLGYRVGSVTPHITYSIYERDLEDYGTGAPPAFIQETTEKSTAITIGARWDFHPSAALKFEYETRSDKSDDDITAIKGDWREVDLISAGIDIIF